ncbi:MAG TPA: peptidylprolyl isomerase [Candidatus Nanoarchaeia archaeon]|nr:peptidylprolyl isomerase [Candidatus Nanoarchaeia archaeon]
MPEKIKLHDFIEVDYTGKLPDGLVFDTTIAQVAQEQHIHSEKMKYGPATICVGEKQLLPGLDEQLVDKDIGKEYTVTLSPEHAFGKRDIKKVKIIPMNTFREHKMQPHPGLQIDVDGEMGTVSNVSGGRVIVNFNHPLAGKEVVYTFKIRRKVDDAAEQITSFLAMSFKIPEKQMKVQVQEGKATVELPVNLPPPLTDALVKKLGDLTKVKEIEFRVKGTESK